MSDPATVIAAATAAIKLIRELHALKRDLREARSLAKAEEERSRIEAAIAAVEAEEQRLGIIAGGVPQEGTAR